MGRNNRQRRAAKRLARAGGGPARPRARDRIAVGPGPTTPPPPPEDRLRDQTRDLVDRIFIRLGLLWERGWLPLDILHVVRRVDAKLVPLAAEIVGDQTSGLRVDQRAPQEWRDQWTVLDAEIRMRPAAVDGTQLLYALNLLAATLECSPTLPSSDLPPSAWGRTTRQAARPEESIERQKMLNRVRALLAKAEATGFAAEAEAFTAKAQDLMTRHAIDHALVVHPLQATAEDVTVVIRRIHLLNPYVATKVTLLNAVARANRTRVVHMAGIDMAVLVGTPVDVEQVEMLFTSLLVQATAAMNEAGARQPGSFDRSATFRRAFLTGYALRIGERLVDADAEAAASYGSALVPMLRAQEEAVQAEFDRLFPKTRTPRARSFDSYGWEAGRQAADRARFAAGRITA